MNITDIKNQKLLFAGLVIGLAALIVPFALYAQISESGEAEVGADYEMSVGSSDSGSSGNWEAPYPGIPGGIENLKRIKGQLGIGARSDVAVSEEGTICTMDAMQCPDGSWVGRSGPNCAFVCGGTSTSVDVSGEIQGDWNSGSSESSNPGFFGSISNIFDIDSWFATDVENDVQFESSVEAEGDVSSDGTVEISAAEESDIAVSSHWLDSFFAGLRNFFGFRWWGGIGSDGEPRPWSDVRFNADPRAGVAPLEVSFTVASRGNAPHQFSLEFGDGKTASFSSTDGNCEFGVSGRCTNTISQTYATRGTYTAVLYEIEDLCGGNPECMAPIQKKEVGRIVIRVASDDGDANNTATFSAQPTSGTAPLRVTFTATLRGSADRYYVGFGDGLGDGTFVQCNFSDPMKCSVEHTYRQPGTYTANLIQSMCPRNAEGCLAPEMIVATVIVKVR